MSRGRQKYIPTANLEYFVLAKGSSILGIDEVGRGSLAGPVVAAVVLISNTEDLRNLGYIRDSKVLTANKREEAYELIINSYKYAIGTSSCREIDKYGIRYATYLAMRRAYVNLASTTNISTSYLLVDGQKTVIKLPVNNAFYYSYGDARIFSIAAASIIAKVYRDKLLSKLHSKYPVYNWKKNKGYGTLEHRLAISRFGESPYHRRTFLSNI